MAFHARLPSLATLLLCALLAVCKLALVRNDEIVAYDTPHDTLRFAEMARDIIDGRWLGDYDQRALIRAPVFPLWIAAVHQTGLPLRTANELLLIAAAAVFCASLRAIGLPRWLCLAAYAAVVFHPFSLYYNRELLPEAFYTPVLFLTLGGLVTALNRPLSPAPPLLPLAGSGLGLALLWHTRPEGPLLLLPLGCFVLLDLWRRSGQRDTARARVQAACVLLAVPLLPVLLLNLALRGMNLVHYGLFAVTDLSAPAYVAAQKALLGIRPDDRRPFVSITAETRRRAYAVSPAFRELQPLLEGALGRQWSVYGCKELRVCDDIASGWFYWAMRDAVAVAGHYTSAGEAETFHARVAGEIDAARASGRLPARRVPFGLLDPDLGKHAPHLAPALGRILDLFRRLPSADMNEPPTRYEIAELITRVAHRRRELVPLVPGHPPAESTARPLPGSAALASSHYRELVSILTALALLGLATLLILRRRIDRADPIHGVVVLFGMAVASRVAFFTLMLATSQATDYERYLYPVLPLYLCTALIVVHQALREVRSAFRGG